jgi:hypothetical protein
MIFLLLAYAFIDSAYYHEQLVDATTKLTSGKAQAIGHFAASYVPQSYHASGVLVQ